MDEAEDDVLAHMAFPKHHWRQLHSTNPLERLNGEIKRRTDVVAIFPNEDTIQHLVGAPATCRPMSNGADPARDAIVEIGAVDLRRDNTITNFRETLVNPGVLVSPAASAVHHLIDVDLAEAPPLADAIDQFKGADATSRTIVRSKGHYWIGIWAAT